MARNLEVHMALLTLFHWLFFQVNLGQPVLLKQRMMEVVVTTGGVSRAKL